MLEIEEQSRKFLFEVVRAGGKPVERPAFVESSQDWCALIDVLKSWRLRPVLAECALDSPWKTELPDQIRLELEEVRAQARLKRAAAQHELDLLLDSFARSRVEIVVLGPTNFFHLGLPILSEESPISFAVRDLDACLLVMGRRGYRGSGRAETRTVELKHTGSVFNVQIYSSSEDVPWESARSQIVRGNPVYLLSQQLLADSVRARVLRSASSPELLQNLCMLAQLDPGAKELETLIDPQRQRVWLANRPTRQAWLGGISKLLRAWTKSAQIS